MAYGVNMPFGLRPFYGINSGTLTQQTRPYLIYSNSNLNPGDANQTYGVSIFTGDPVRINQVAAQAGTIAAYVIGYTPSAPSTYGAGPILGVFQGCQYIDPKGQLQSSPYWPGGTAVKKGTQITAFIMDDPTVVYDIQVSSPTVVWQNAIFPNQGNGTTYRSIVGVNLALDSQTNVFTNRPAYPIADNPGNGNTNTGQSAYYAVGASINVLGTNNTDYHKTGTTQNADKLPLKVVGITPNQQNLDLYYKNLALYQANPNTAPGVGTTANPFINVLVTINNHYYKAPTETPALI